MTLKNYEKIKEQAFIEKLPNGLTVIVIPKQGFNKSYAFFATDYGGADRRFKLGGQWIDTPEGVAHFLEHKMFDTKDGNALTLLSENGASPNAFTSADMTAYHFECTEKFEENLRVLLSFVSEPYFTPESVQKEQGIIGQEIRMTEDDPDYTVYYNLMKALFKKNPIRDSVAGTVESIAEITADTLYNCHKVFYHPSNMVLCVAGAVDPERVAAIAKEILPASQGEVPERDYGGTDDGFPEVSQKEAEMEVSMPMFIVGSKVKPQIGRDFLRQEITAELALEILAGRSSPLFLRLYASGLINNSFSAAFESAAGAGYVVIGGESKDPFEVKNEIVKEVSSLKTGPDKLLFERLKKAVMGKKLRELNSFDNICYNQARGYFRGFDPFESFEIINTISKQDITSFFENLLSEKIAISIVHPHTDKKEQTGTGDPIV